jgi:hypothetical protein
VASWSGVMDGRGMVNRSTTVMSATTAAMATTTAVMAAAAMANAMTSLGLG